MLLADHVRRLLDQREAQGLPRHIETTAVLAKVVTIVRAASQREAA